MNTDLFQNCEIGMSMSSFCVHADSEATAFSLITNRLRQVANQAARFSRCEALIYYPGCKTPLQIPVAMSAIAEGLDEPAEEAAVGPNPDLLGADYLKILEFLQEQREDGKIVIITSNTTNICLHTSDLLKPSRAVLTAAQFTGYNYSRSWRATRDDDPANPHRLNPQFEELQDRLERDGYVPGFEYQLFRPDDFLCGYKTDFFLCRDYCGDKVRIGVSEVKDWQIIEPAPELAKSR